MQSGLGSIGETRSTFGPSSGPTRASVSEGVFLLHGRGLAEEFLAVGDIPVGPAKLRHRHEGARSGAVLRGPLRSGPFHETIARPRTEMRNAGKNTAARYEKVRED